MMNREHQPTNEELMIPPKERWEVPRRNSFKLTVSVQRRNTTEMEIMKFQRRVEELASHLFQGGSIEYQIS